MKTLAIKPNQIKQNWYIVDAENKTLGRLATVIATRLRGKHKPEYTPNMDLGDSIIVINASKVHVTGNKEKDKIYYHHSGYTGHMKTINFEKLIVKKPEYIIQKAVKGMLPRGPLGYAMLKKLKVYAGPEHEHLAQKPIKLEIEA